MEPVDSKIKRVRLELKGFEKVFIRAGESVRVEFTLTDDFYRVWGKDGWCVPGGQYKIHLGSSCRDLRLSTEVSVKEKGNVCVPEENISAADFQAQVHRPFTMRNTLNEMKNKSGTMNILYKIIRAAFAMKFLGKRNYSPQTYRLLVTSCFDNSFAGLKQSAGLKFPLLEFFLKLANAGL